MPFDNANKQVSGFLDYCILEAAKWRMRTNIESGKTGY